MEKISIGKIVKAQGIKGEVKIKGDSDILASIGKLKVFIVKEQNITAKSIRTDGDFAYILFSTIADRNQAEELVGLSVFVDESAIKLKEDNFFVKDMLGSNVFLTDGKFVGIVEEIMQNGKCAEVYVVKTESGAVMFPFLQDLYVSFDKAEKKLVLNLQRFGEVVLYED